MIAAMAQPGRGAGLVQRPAASQPRSGPTPAPLRHAAPQQQRPARAQPARAAAPAAAAGAPPPVRPEDEVPGMTEFLDRLKWDSNGLVVAIAQHADTGEVLMQAFADRAAVCETLQTG